MTGVSPERAAYEAHHDGMCCPWEECTADERELWKRVAGAAINASPELAEARATITRLSEALARISRTGAASVTETGRLLGRIAFRALERR